MTDKDIDFRSRLSRFQIIDLLFMNCMISCNYLTSLYLCFLVCKKGIENIIVPTPKNAMKMKRIPVYKAIKNTLFMKTHGEFFSLAISVKKIYFSP